MVEGLSPDLQDIRVIIFVESDKVIAADDNPRPSATNRSASRTQKRGLASVLLQKECIQGDPSYAKCTKKNTEKDST